MKCYNKVMALYVKQNEKRSELQERLVAELQEKAKKRAETMPPDGVTDSNYLKDTKATTSLAWLWVIAALLVLLVIFMVLITR